MTPGVEEKARRLLTEGRVHVWCDSTGLRAMVEGDTGAYAISFSKSGRPSCPCESWRQRCSHALAVELVTNSSKIEAAVGTDNPRRARRSETAVFGVTDAAASCTNDRRRDA